MACGCNSGDVQSVPAVEPQYVVTFPDGRQTVVQGEMAAKIEATAGGGTYQKR